MPTMKTICTKTIKIIVCAIGVCAVIMFLRTSYRQPKYPSITAVQQIHRNDLCPIFTKTKQQPDEERIAKHFAEDTLPGLMKKGLIKKYRRTAIGTYIAVNGALWKSRSEYFKHCLLKELLVYNTFHGYPAAARIMDSTSGKLYAQITPSSKTNFYD